MRSSLWPRVFSGLLCGSVVFSVGCSNPASQSLVSLSVSASPSTLTVGGASALKAIAHLSDGTTQDVSNGTQWTVSNPALASVSQGTMTALAAGTVSVQAVYVEVTPAGSSPAAASTTPATLNASMQLTINAAGPVTVPTVPVITWNAPAAITYGTALSSTQLNATANVPGSFAYTPAAGAVLTAGTQTLAVTFSPSDSQTYASATASVPLNIAQAAPVITWATPAAITAGTALSATQLDATASVPGSFVYSPAIGSVPAAGAQTLTTVFTPSDAVDFSSATAHTSLTVNPVSTPTPPTPPKPPAPPTSPVQPVGCGGPTVNLNPGMSQSTLQTTIASAPVCSLIVFSAGTYNLTAPLTARCGAVHTGPAATTPTAILNAPAGDFALATSGCTSGTTSIQYLAMVGGGIRVGQDESGIDIEHNQITGLESSTTNHTQAHFAAVYVGGPITSTISNLTILYNTFGDASSCTAVYATTIDEGGYCAGVFVIIGAAINNTIEYNFFNHVEEGVHYNNQLSAAAGQGTLAGSQQSVVNNLQIKYNYFLGWHRIATEIQTGILGTAPMSVSHNAYVDPINPSWGTMFISDACCTGGQYFLRSAPPSPANTTNDNVMIAEPQNCQTVGQFHAPVIGIEYWGGAGSTASWNYIGSCGTNAVNWGFAVEPYYITNNFLCNLYGGSYITDEEGSAAPTLANNTTAATCSSLTTAAPVITQSGTTVTITDTGVAGVPDGQPMRIFYTTDGSTPTVNSPLYSGPFSPPAGSVIKAIAMWGVDPMPIEYPTNYGYVPSAVVSATFTGSGSAIKAAASRVSAIGSGAGGTGVALLRALTITPDAPALAIGNSAQLKALATFSDGSSRDVTSQVAWTSSDMRTILASPSGLLTALAGGHALLTASYLGQQTAVLATSSVGEYAWQGPLVITQGGTYRGDWQSTDAGTPAVTIATQAPVILEDAHLRGAGNLIQVDVPGANLTVRNSLGVALAAARKGEPNGVFLDAGSPARLDVENNYMENVRSGVELHGYRGSRAESETIVIRGNRARNLGSRLSDGQGGYLSGEAAATLPSRFIDLSNVQSVPGIDLGWNEVIDYPTQSLVSEVIEVYRSSGTLNHPLEIHDSYIQGAYPYHPGQDAYQGGGIETDGAADDTGQTASAFAYIHDNQVVGTVGYGIAFAAGHDNVAVNNRVLSSGLLADGTRIAAQRVGLAMASSNRLSYNNTMHDNLVGWTCWTAACGRQGFRQDQYFPASPADYAANSVVEEERITPEMEEGEYQLWLSKTASAGVRIGPMF